jgi:hypothetical protein
MSINLNISSNTYGDFSQRVGSHESLNSDKKTDKDKKESSKDDKTSNKLTIEQKLMVGKLEARDTHVRAHEAAHQSAGASTGAAHFSYQKGPDGKMYAIGGDVSISYQTGATPQETISNAQTVINAALAPTDPSPQDYAVASSAKVMMMKAEQELSKEQLEKIIGKDTYKNDKNQETDNAKSKNIDIST